MKIEIVTVGNLETNCYVITNNNSTIIIDPGAEPKKIIDFCKSKNIVGILVTHHHDDHIGALKEIEKEYNLEYNNFEYENFKFKTLKTPGHTSDSISFYFEKEKILFSGDFIFYHNIGRWDLGGNPNDMKNSIKYILTYPKDITIYPGHGIHTNLNEEVPYLERYLD